MKHNTKLNLLRCLVTVATLLFGSASQAFFHSDSLPNCNDENVKKVASRFSIELITGISDLDQITDPWRKIQNMELGQVRMDSYDKEYKKRICSAILNVTNRLGAERYKLVYSVYGTSDGSQLAIIDYKLVDREISEEWVAESEKRSAARRKKQKEEREKREQNDREWYEEQKRKEAESEKRSAERRKKQKEESEKKEQEDRERREEQKRKEKEEYQQRMAKSNRQKAAYDKCRSETSRRSKEWTEEWNRLSSEERSRRNDDSYNKTTEIEKYYSECISRVNEEYR